MLLEVKCKGFLPALIYWSRTVFTCRLMCVWLGGAHSPGLQTKLVYGWSFWTSERGKGLVSVFSTDDEKQELCWTSPGLVSIPDWEEHSFFKCMQTCTFPLANSFVSSEVIICSYPQTMSSPPPPAVMSVTHCTTLTWLHSMFPEKWCELMSTARELTDPLTNNSESPLGNIMHNCKEINKSRGDLLSCFSLDKWNMAETYILRCPAGDLSVAGNLVVVLVSSKRSFWFDASSLCLVAPTPMHINNRTLNRTAFSWWLAAWSPGADCCLSFRPVLHNQV